MLGKILDNEKRKQILRSKKFVFVTGTPRAGTSAMVNLLNCHDQILIGQERFNFTINRNELTPLHFSRENFLSKKDGETHSGGGIHLRAASDKERGDRYNNAGILGDKYPKLYLHYDSILEEFPECRIIYITRNPFSVAESYHARWSNPDDSWYRSESGFRKGVEDWNESHRSTIAAIKKYGPERFKVVEQERFFQNQDLIDQLFNGLGMKIAPHAATEAIMNEADEYDGKSVVRENKIMSFVMRNADWQAYAEFRVLAGI